MYLWVLRADRAPAELAAEAGRALRLVFGPGDLDRRASLGVRVAGLEELAGVGALPPLRVLSWVHLRSPARLLKDQALERWVQVPGGPASRGGDPFPADGGAVVLSRRYGPALTLAHRDHDPLAWAALHHGGACTWSVCWRPRVGAVRFDGRGVRRQGDYGPMAERDRTGVLVAGLTRLLAQPVEVAEDWRVELPDVLAEVGRRGRLVRLVDRGRWLEGEEAAEGEVRAETSLVA